MIKPVLVGRRNPEVHRPVLEWIRYVTPYSLDAKAGKCLMIKPVLVGRRNPEAPSSGMDPRTPET